MNYVPDNNSSLVVVAKLFGKIVQEIVARSCRLKIGMAKTAQFMQSLQLCEDIGAFVSFNGAYNGLLVLNFQGEAALEIVSASFRAMGLPENEIPTHYMSENVRNGIGELLNQIIGAARAEIQSKYELSAEANIPAVVPVTTPIGLIFKSSIAEQMGCVRLSFQTANLHRFHMDLTLEPTQFLSIA